MRIHVGQIGCRLNYSEMETLAARLRAAGHTIVARPEDAQVIVFNTCAVTADAARGSRKEARALHAANPAARIALTGCWATLAPAEAAALPGVALVAQNAQKELLPLLLEPWSALFDAPGDLDHLHPGAAPSLVGTDGERRSRTRAFLKVQDGCDNRCTFCVVTVARGAARSVPLQELVAEAQRLAANGVQEIVLTGVHLGSYGRDLRGDGGPSLKQLIQGILDQTDVRRLRLSSLEPWELADGFFDLWARWPGRLCPHLHLPLQAGTDKQLRAMARRCTTASFRALVAEARAAIPDLILTTDLIAGFPGETEDDFAAGLDFVEEMRFADGHVFPFSARAGTVAASFAGDPPGEVKRERARRLRATVARTGAIERARHLGSVRPVLWEGQGQPLAQSPDRALWRGLTDNALRVHAETVRDLDLHNMMTLARLAALEGDVLHGVLEPAGSPFGAPGVLY